MNKLTRKLMISVFTLAFALVTLGATTFAWFTLTSVAKIDPYTVGIEVGEGIEISLDGETFKSFITNAELKSKIGDKVFDPVTSSNGVNFKYLNGQEADEKDYIEFVLFARTPVADRNLVLLPSTNIKSTERTWIADIGFDYTDYGNLTNVEATDPVKVYAANAFRMSFEEASELTFTAEAAITADFSSSQAKVFELNPLDNGGRNIRLDNQVKTVGLLDYYNKKVQENQKLSVNDATLPDTVYDNDALGKQPLAALDKENTVNDNDVMHYSAVKIRMWLEGWDPDSFDAILGSNVIVELYFGVAEPETTP